MKRKTRVLVMEDTKNGDGKRKVVFGKPGDFFKPKKKNTPNNQKIKVH